MAVTQSKSRSTQPQLERVKQVMLRFDEENPRLAELGEPKGQPEILRTLWRDMAVDEIALSIAANGFFQHEPLYALKDNGFFTVVEGNRRLAAVRVLLDPVLQRALKVTDLPKLTAQAKAQLQELPVYVCDSKREIWPFFGFRHVNGPLSWGSFAKAEYIAFVHNEFGISLNEIARRIGDRHAQVRRFYRALMVLRQAERKRLFSRSDGVDKRFPFSHLYTGLDYDGIQSFLGLRKDEGFSVDPIKPAKLKNLRLLLLWLFGSKSKDKKPLIKSQNPDLLKLDETLMDARGVDALRSGHPLEVSHRISLGDEHLFRDALVGSKTNLQQAKATVVGGYKGGDELLEYASEIEDLAVSLVGEMRQINRRPSTKRE